MSNQLPNLKDMKSFEPISAAQTKTQKIWKNKDHLILSGSAGTGKTFLALALALQLALDNNCREYEKIIIIRSVVPTREIGFLPGNLDEKTMVYKEPYVSIIGELFGKKDAYKKLEESGKIQFLTSSFLRGVTFHNSIVIVDEMQNCNAMELHTIMTRLSSTCRIIFCGDYYQSDLEKVKDKNSILAFLNIIEKISSFGRVNFTSEDIVRSDVVKEYIMIKERIESNSVDDPMGGLNKFLKL